MKICELQCKIYSSILLQKYIFDMKKKCQEKKHYKHIQLNKFLQKNVFKRFESIMMYEKKRKFKSETELEKNFNEQCN